MENDKMAVAPRGQGVKGLRKAGDLTISSPWGAGRVKELMESAGYSLAHTEVW